MSSNRTWFLASAVFRFGALSFLHGDGRAGTSPAALSDTVSARSISERTASERCGILACRRRNSSPAVEFTAQPDEDSAGAILFAGVAHDLISFAP
jgi:hypothetical protein